jgi:hypothetical protein
MGYFQSDNVSAIKKLLRIPKSPQEKLTLVLQDIHHLTLKRIAVNALIPLLKIIVFINLSLFVLTLGYWLLTLITPTMAPTLTISQMALISPTLALGADFINTLSPGPIILFVDLVLHNFHPSHTPHLSLWVQFYLNVFTVIALHIFSEHFLEQITRLNASRDALNLQIKEISGGSGAT